MKQDIAEIAGKLTRAQQWFVSSLAPFWTLPSEIGANPNHTSNRDRRLIEASTEGEGREYRLTDLGLAVRAHLLAHSHPEKQAPFAPTLHSEVNKDASRNLGRPNLEAKS